jgi:hypothetical protein
MNIPRTLYHIEVIAAIDGALENAEISLEKSLDAVG